MTMTYCIGVDGGGTKTLGVLTDRQGTVLATATTGATNPNDVTPSVSADRLTTLVHALLETAGLPTRTLGETTLFFGIAGGINHGPTLEALLGERLSAPALRVRSDAHILLSGEVPTGDGACIICGTGSVCFLRRGEDILRIGGWGYLLDSGGSGYDIGRDALEAALRHFDGRGEPTVLSAMLAEYLGGPVNTRITEIYREGKPYVASCAPLVFRAAEAGDAVACSILRRNARRLAEYIETAWRHLTAKGTPETLPVVMGGGISQKASPYWRDLVASLVDPAVPAHITVATMPPVFGAVVEARKQADDREPIDFAALRAAFRDSFSD